MRLCVCVCVVSVWYVCDNGASRGYRISGRGRGPWVPVVWVAGGVCVRSRGPMDTALPS